MNILKESIGEGVYKVSIIIIIDNNILLHRELFSMIRSITGITILKTIETKSSERYDSAIIEIKFDIPPPGKGTNDRPEIFLKNVIIPKIQKIKGVLKVKSYGKITPEKSAATPTNKRQFAISSR